MKSFLFDSLAQLPGGFTSRLWMPLALVLTYEIALIAMPQIERQLWLTSADRLQTWLPSSTKEIPFTVVLIDNKAENVVGPWPWPRGKVAELIETVGAFEPAAIAIDIIFKNSVAMEPEEINTLSKAIGRSRSVMIAEVEKNAQRGLVETTGISWIGEPSVEPLPDWEGDILALPAPIKAAAAGLGVAAGRTDEDGVVRMMPLLLKFGDILRPSLESEVLRVLEYGDAISILTEGEPGQAMITGLAWSNLVVPLNPAGELWINFGIDRSVDVISASDLLSGNKDANLAGRIVLLGVDLPLVGRQWLGPDSRYHSSIWLHAKAISTILSESFLSRPAWVGGIERVLTILMILVLVWRWVSHNGSIFVLSLVLVSGAVVLAIAAFYAGGVLGSPIRIGAPLMLVGFASTAQRYLENSRERQRVRQVFSRYVAPEVVKLLLDDPKKLQMGGETKLVTILLVDVRGFTGITERLTAQELVCLMNAFLRYCGDIILRHQGTIDKFIGDSVLAFWNAPLEQDDHADRACDAAAEIVQRLKDFHQDFATSFPEISDKIETFSVGIAVNSGMCAVGNVGSETHSNYTVLGDPVNVTARLEELTKSLKIPVLIGGETVAECERGRFELVDQFAVRGREQPIAVYRPRDIVAQTSDPYDLPLFRSLSKKSD